MNVNFDSKKILAATKSAKKMFDKSPLGAESEDAEHEAAQDCLVASKDDGTVTLEAANMGLHVKLSVPADVEEAGRVMVPRDRFSDLKLRGKATRIKYTSGENALAFKSGSFSGKLNVNQDFEAVEGQRSKMQPKTTFSVPAEALKQGIKYVMFSTDVNDEDYPTLPLQLSVKDRKLVLATNDGYRAAMFRANVVTDAKVEESILLPGPFFAEIVSFLDSDETVKFGLNEKMFRIVSEGVDVTHPLMQVDEAKLIDVEKYIEKMEKEQAAIEFMLDPKEARESVQEVVSVVPKDMNGKARLDLTVSDKSNKAALKVMSVVGAGDSKFAVSNVVINETIGVAVDSRFVGEFLTMLGSGETVVKVWDGQILMKSEICGAMMIMPQVTD